MSQLFKPDITIASQVHNGTHNGHNSQVQETEEPDVFGTYGDVHRMFVQAMMNRCTIAASEFSPLFEMICKNCNIQLDTYTKGDKQKALIVATNKVLESKCNMKVIKVYDEELTKKVSSLVLINRTDRSRDTNKLTIKDQLTFAPHELEYLKLILDEIMENPMRQIKSTKALNVSKNMDKNTKKIQPHEAEAILQKFKDNKWLVEKDGIILLSTRFIYEMEPFLKDVYTDYVNQCALCRKIAIRCIKCKSTLPERFQGVETQPRQTQDDSGSPDRSQYQSQPGQKRKRIQQMESDSD